MNSILLDEKEVEVLEPNTLPLLIHGAEGSGASLYTICLVAKWFKQGYDIVFLCGFPMAEQQFAQQVGGNYDRVRFYTQEKREAFEKVVSTESLENTIIVIKNAELFPGVVDRVASFSNLVVSGDVNQAEDKERIRALKFATSIYFSPLESGDELVRGINKYEGVVVSEGYRGVTKLR